jgi:two-component system sensor histidine kinase AlgZ
VILRVFVLAEAINLSFVYAYGTGGLAELITLGPQRLAFDLCLLMVVLALFVTAQWLQALSYRVARMVTVGTAMCVPAATTWFIREKFGVLGSVEAGRAAVLGGLVAIAVLLYLQWRALALAISHGHSRLLALQARIRPHFLFNSLNSAVSVIREDPKMAERILLDMSDLFRSVLSEDSTLLTLERELEVARSYIEIEQLRLGDRLKVEWEIDEGAVEALVPVLILQPMLENAVYHGVEPLERGGTIMVRVVVRRGKLIMEVRNPVPLVDRPYKPGNRMALLNIRERIGLHYDSDAHMETENENGHFLVRIELPYRKAGWYENISGRLDVSPSSAKGEGGLNEPASRLHNDK